MESLWYFINNSLLNSEITFANIPLNKIILVGCILIFTQLLRGFFSATIISAIENFTSQTKTQLDDRLIAIIKQPLSWLIFICGLWISNLTVAEYLNSHLEKTISDVVALLAIVAIAFIVYRISPLLGQVLGDLALQTETELDDLIAPQLPKVFKTLAILIVLLKSAEVLLGASAGALIGLVGGTGITLGLLVKDILYDWFCAIVIYFDHLYEVGDIVDIDGIEGLAQIENISLRSTKISIPAKKTIKKIPNSKMITGVLENYSQNFSPEQLLSINLTLQIDDISAAKTIAICEGLRQIPQSIDLLQDDCSVRFSEIKQNARVLTIQVFAKTNNIAVYAAAREEFNLKVLNLMEQKDITLFSSTPIALLPQMTIESERDRVELQEI